MSISNLITIASVALAGLLLIGFLIGFWRSWKKSTIRAGLLLACFIAALIFSASVAKLIVNKFVKGLVLTAFGYSINFEEMAENIAGEMATDLLSDGATMTRFATALLNIAVRMIAFIALFLVLAVITLIIYAIVSAIISSKEKKKAVGESKPKAWERLIGGGVGIIGALIICLALFTPVFGVMNVCDKFVSESNQATAVAYSQSHVAGKFYTEDPKIGKVEEAVQKYYEARQAYKNSFAGKILTITGVDAIGKSTFENLSTVNQDGLKVNLTKECVTMANAYNTYKDNFVAKEFDIATEDGVKAVKELYSVMKKSEVLKTLVTEVVPKFAEKWANDEKYLGVTIPAEGDIKELALDLLDAFNTDNFDVIDENINVLLDTLDIANRNGVLEASKNGGDISTAIANGNFVEDSVKKLAETPKFKIVLPEVLNTTLKIAYKTTVGDPGNKLDQELTQEQVAAIDWNAEAAAMQVIVKNAMALKDSENMMNDLGGFGEIIDAARDSAILSEPTKTLITDYITANVSDAEVGAAAKTEILNTIDGSWDNEDYSYETLFDTVSKAAKIADSLANAEVENLNFDELSDTIKELVKTDAAAVKTTVATLVNDGLIEKLVGTGDLADSFKQMVLTIVNNTTPETVDADVNACQVIVNIIVDATKTTPAIDFSKYGGENENEQAETLVERLAASQSIMTLAADSTNNASIRNFIAALPAADRAKVTSAITSVQTAGTITAGQASTLNALFA